MGVTQEDRDYYRQRAVVEFVRASEGLDTRVMACHLELARRYELLVLESEPDRLAIPMLAA